MTIKLVNHDSSGVCYFLVLKVFNTFSLREVTFSHLIAQRTPIFNICHKFHSQQKLLNTLLFFSALL